MKIQASSCYKKHRSDKRSLSNRVLQGDFIMHIYRDLLKLITNNCIIINYYRILFSILYGRLRNVTNIEKHFTVRKIFQDKDVISSSYFPTLFLAKSSYSYNCIDDRLKVTLIVMQMVAWMPHA